MMLKELLKQMQDFRERITKEVGYRCDVRIDLEGSGLGFIFFSKLNTSDMLYLKHTIEYKEIADNVDDREVDKLVEIVSHYFRQKIQANCRHRWVIGDTDISNPDRVPIQEKHSMKCGRCDMDYLFWQHQASQPQT